jgi:peptidoglycan-associated lipoprotein
MKSVISMSIALALLCACGSEKKPAIAPTGQMEPTPATANNDAAQKSPTKSVVHISDEIRKACGISDADAYFDFDSARLKSRNYPVLEKLAKCFASGPLKGRHMRLVGHADPRGEPEYNLVLGGHRADGVKRFLVKEGLSATQATASSRGEMDATGTDEATWAKDRRVDVMLAN